MSVDRAPLNLDHSHGSSNRSDTEVPSKPSGMGGIVGGSVRGKYESDPVDKD